LQNVISTAIDYYLQTISRPMNGKKGQKSQYYHRDEHYNISAILLAIVGIANFCLLFHCNIEGGYRCHEREGGAIMNDK